MPRILANKLFGGTEFHGCGNLKRIKRPVSSTVMSSVTRVSMESMTRATLPFLIPLLLALMVITYVPAISMWLPDLVFGPGK